jgi:phosphoglycolate phosphatase
MTFVRPRAVLFDWDNTLVENWRAIQAALNAALDDAQLPQMDLEQVVFQGRHSARDIFPKLFGEGWQHARSIFYDHLAQNHLAGLSVMPGARELLDTFVEKGVMLAVVSNKKGDLLRREIAYLGWADKFFRVVGAQDAVADKPDPAPVFKALEGTGIVPGDDVWLVGDTDTDMRAALAAGCWPVLVGPGPADPELLSEAQPALRCHNCGDLTAIVRRNWNTICL